ncbi:hypothetical protein FA95DRAFT_653370 [Auriscalpium vulgare]|uniref:Uncharacterized protein n=1 Tax=Auriscalpium vulgare TaxID=40419 RepID=A0ACB8RDP8_9AGAM|nr:hypothetical protein FA95DRAFT_653370 [Auriscalpium vulgare]
MATVPLDIQVIILEWVYQSSQHDAIDYATLRACALVCRAWRLFAQRLLVRRVPYPSLYNLDYGSTSRNSPFKFAPLLRTLRAAPHLAAHVRSTVVNTPLNAELTDTIIAVLELCANMAGIIIGALPTNASFIARLHTIPVRPVFLCVVGSSTLANRILDIWPSVRFLDVGMSGMLRIPPGVQALAVASEELHPTLMSVPA